MRKSVTKPKTTRSPRPKLASSPLYAGKKSCSVFVTLVDVSLVDHVQYGSMIQLFFGFIQLFSVTFGLFGPHPVRVCAMFGVFFVCIFLAKTRRESL